MKFRTKSKKEMGVPVGIGFGWLTSMIITLAGAAIIAWMISSERIGESIISPAGLILTAISAVAGAWIAAMLTKRLRLQVCLLAGGCYYVTLIGITALLFDGAYQGMLLPAIVILAGSALVAFLPGAGSRAGGHRKKAYR